MMRLEHVGIAVSNIEDALKTFEDLLGTSRYKTEEVASENVITHFFWADGVKIELLESTHPESVVSRFLNKRGEGVHHLAFSVDDLQFARIKLESLGFRIIGEESKSGADGKRIFFLHPKDAFGVLIECCAMDLALKVPGDLTTLAPNVTVRTFGTDINPCVIIASCHAPSRAASFASGTQLARRLEPVAYVKLIEWQNDDELKSGVAENIHRLIGVKESHCITIGASAYSLLHLLQDVGARPRSWIRIEQPEKGASAPDGLSPSDHKLLILVGEASSSAMSSEVSSGSKTDLWPTATLPAYAVCLDEPSSDALFPLIRSFWKSEQ